MPTKKPKTEADVRSLARAYTPMIIRTLGGLAVSAASENARIAACEILLNRGWGKAAQPLTGAGGDDITVTIRTIIEGNRK